MKNLLISNLDKKDVEHFTTDLGLMLRKRNDRTFKKLCNIFTNAHIIEEQNGKNLTDEEYFLSLNTEYIPIQNYQLKSGKNNIVIERYPNLKDDEPYIFVCNHTCPEDIETILNILDRNAYLLLGSIESLKYNPEMYLLFLNGMIPFDIMDQSQRKQSFFKMSRVLKSNSVLIFPEGSHNYSPNNLINPLFDGPINLSLQTNRKIVAVTLLRDNDNNISYVDVSNPIDINKLKEEFVEKTVSFSENEKYYVNKLSSILRDKMATAVYYMIIRHSETLVREEYFDIEEQIRIEKIQDAFSKLNWKNDVFDAEYLIKKTKDEKNYEEVVKNMSDLVMNLDGISDKYWLLNELNLENKDVASRMRKYWMNTIQNHNSNNKIKVKRK